MTKKLLPIALSNRHVHLSQEHLDTLFGKGYSLTKFKDLSQPGQYACNEKIDIVGPKGSFNGVRILGPVRPDTQIEVSLTDGFTLGIKSPVRASGDIQNSPGVKMVGPAGEVTLDKGVIAASRHIHMHTSDAEKFGVQDKEIVKIRTSGDRAVVFENVLVRVHPTFALEMHIDIDEGNASQIKNGDMVELIKE
jgi:putative phosphotransacetylase